MVLFEDKVGCSKALYRKTNADANKHQRPRTPEAQNLAAKNWPLPNFGEDSSEMFPQKARRGQYF